MSELIKHVVFTIIVNEKHRKKAASLLFTTMQFSLEIVVVFYVKIGFKVRNIKKYTRYALQVAFGEASTCGALETTFYEASEDIMTALKSLNADGNWGTTDDLEWRQLAYDTALNAIKQKNADVALVNAPVSQVVIHLILFVIFLAGVTFLGRHDRLMIDDLQKREDEYNSRPVKR